MDLLVGLLAPVGATAIVALLGWGVRRHFRFRRPLRVSAARREELRELAQRIDRRTLIPVFLMLFGCPAVVTVVLDQLATLWLARLPGTVYFFDMVTPRATWLRWVLPTGMIWGFCLAWWVCTILIIRRYGRSTTAKYIVAGKLRFGMDYVRACRVCLTLLAVLCVPFAVLELDWYARVEEEAFVVNEFWGLGERRYPFDQIDEIMQTSHLTTKTGKVTHRPRYVILFTDGREWCMDPAFEEYAPAMEYVSQKSRKPIQRVRFIEDIRGH
ncbi:MAG TPA: hypothetical protein VKE74_02250 [Gemmataceae bacterium]|nr:hypothetical protein [Gemmataceae bacterium]